MLVVTNILAFTVNLTGEVITGGIAVCGVIAIVVGFIYYKANGLFKLLRDKDEKRGAHAAKEESDLRERLLTRYKEMYEQERDRSSREIEDLRRQIAQIKLELDSVVTKHRELRDTYDRLKDEYNKVVELNLKYQQDRLTWEADKKRDEQEIVELRKEVAELQERVAAFQHKLDAQP